MMIGLPEKTILYLSILTFQHFLQNPQLYGPYKIYRKEVQCLEISLQSIVNIKNFHITTASDPQSSLIYSSLYL